MKRPAITSYRRPTATARRAPRTRAEAAVELVRAEFDSARLERELDQLDRRAAAARHALAAGRRRARNLLDRLAEEQDRS